MFLARNPIKKEFMHIISALNVEPRLISKKNKAFIPRI
jgi:hypothetical protein